MYRQGDLLFLPVPSVPKNAKPQAGTVLAEGEVTGHFHRAVAVADAEIEVFTAADGVSTADGVDKWLRSAGPVTITHEEHAPVQLPAGSYLVRRQREYDPAIDRVVVD